MTTPHDEKYFSDMLTELCSELIPKIPSLGSSTVTQQQRLHGSLESVTMAQKTRDACKKAQDKAKTNEEKKATNEALVAAEQALKQATDEAIEASTPILTHLLQESLLQNDSLDPLLVKCSILCSSIKQLAEFCKQGDTQSTALIDDLLSNDELMKDMLYNGGAKGGNYGQAMEIYTSIITPSTDDEEDILQRLKLGTSLEQAVPVHIFGAGKNHIDPVARYHHYEQAFLNKELDPTFFKMSTWECRYITDSDATDDQLTWGRKMLRNYRPDIMEMKDYKWRYVYIVRTDVPYRKPTWTSHPKTFDQIISGGGKCGPRAWFGRFACKAFGIASWGVRQPGHAAVGHWTPNEGWVTCLGAGWKFSTWEGREGLDFVLEAQAREQRGDYMGVCRLEWVADALGEKQIHGKLNPDCPWRSLALLQKHHLANITASSPTCTEGVAHSIMDGMDGLAIEDKDHSITYKNDGTIFIPAVACSKPNKATPKAIYSKSFLGGMQLHIAKDQSVEYTLTLKESQRYQLVIRLVTVHDKMSPLLLKITTVSDGGDSKMCGNKSIQVGSFVVIPYTKGDWRVTDPVEISLGNGTNVLNFQRKAPDFGLTMKELVLTPITSLS